MRYGTQSHYLAPIERTHEGVSIWNLARPRQLFEINAYKLTQYSRRVCNGCNGLLAWHWQRPVRTQDVTRWFCYRDGTAYAGASHVRL